MKINCREFIDTKKELFIYNTLPYIVSAVDIYYSGEDASLMNDLLEPNSDGLPKLILNIDGVDYPIINGSPGEGPMNPIIYTKPLNTSKIKIRDLNNGTITGIVGSTNGPELDDWAVGTNINELNDFISIKLKLNSLPIKSSKLYGFGSNGFGTDPSVIIGFGGYDDNFIVNGGTITVEISSNKEYNFMYRDVSPIVIGGKDIFGFGESSWGGVSDGVNEGYGGVL